MQTKLKRSLSLLLALGMAMGLLCGNAWAVEKEKMKDVAPTTMESEGTCGDDVTWTLDDDGTLTISGTGHMEDRDDYYSRWVMKDITSVIIQEGVTSIGNGAFNGCSSLVDISIPNSVTKIGKNAFNQCDNLSGIVIPNSVTEIGNSAFEYCSSLTSIMLPDGLTRIGAYTFVYCSSLDSITIPKTVTSIGNVAFNGCSSLSSITIPESVINIGDFAFFNCSSLTSVMIPDSVTSIGRSAFAGCSGLTSVTIGTGVTNIGEEAFCDNGSLVRIDVEESNRKYSSVNGVLFDKNKTELVRYPEGKQESTYNVPDSVKNIGNGAFSCCGSLISVMIADSVVNIGKGAFSCCTNLMKIDVAENNANYCSVNGILFDKNKTKLICYPEGKQESAYTVPNSVVSIGDGAFQNCSSLKDITIPNSVTHIGDDVFMGCSSLASIKLLDGVRSISAGAFFGCSGLTSVTIPSSVMSIGDSAFYDCGELKEVYYAGSESNWQKIEVGNGNDDLTNAVIHYNSVGPTTKIISTCTINLEQTSYTYDGKAKQPTVTVKDGDTTLTSGKDYEVTYADNIDAGTAKVTITGNGDYSGTVTKEFTIQKANQALSASISPSNIQVGETAQITASAKTDVSYSSSDTKVAAVSASGVVTAKAVGTVTITITANASENYNEISHTLQVTVTEPQTTKKISDCVVTLQSMSYTYDGTEKKPVVTVKDGNNTLTNGKDYEVAYANNLNAGTARVTVTGKGNYMGTVTMNVIIKKAASVITASNITKATSAKAQKASIGAKVKGGAKLTYKSNNKYVTVDKKGQVTIAKKFVGQATITINAAATANYNAATKKITVTVNPTGTKLTSVKSTKIGQLTIKWVKNAAVTGYQVQYATSGKFNGAKTLNVKSNKTVTSTLSKLKEKQKYYVRIRTYKTVGKVNYYSAWSAAKSATVKGVTAPAAVKLTSVKSAKAGELTVKWGKNAKAGGYQLQYATAKNFKSAKTVAVKKAKTTSTTIKKLTKGKKYYVRIRTYQKVGGKTYYSAWSASKNVTIKK